MKRKKRGHEITQLRASFVVQGFVFLALFIYWTKVIIRFSFPYCNFSFDWFFFIIIIGWISFDWLNMQFVYIWYLWSCLNSISLSKLAMLFWLAWLLKSREINLLLLSLLLLLWGRRKEKEKDWSIWWCWEYLG